MRSLALAAYLLASHLLEPLAVPVLRRRLRRGKEDPARLAERLGRAGLPRPDGRLVWLHAASVGEATSALPLISALQRRVDATVLLTTGTVSSARRMAGALPPGTLHQYVPVDTRRAVGRFLDHWRPDLGVWIESELWPRLVLETRRRGVPMALVNARLSAGSARRWRRVPGMARRLLGSFRTILAQDNATVERLRALGVQARFGGNLKALVRLPDWDPAELGLMRGALGDRPVWLAASTHAGEEARMLQAQALLLQAAGRTGRGAQRPLLILAPRHPDRADEVQGLIAAAGLAALRRSAGGQPGAEADVWLADSMGEMALWYRLAPVAFVGGSLVPVGGHTPFEPVQLGSAVLHGPHVANFAPVYRALDDGGGALEIADARSLAAAVGRLLAEPLEAEAMRDRARAVHEALKPDVAAIAAELAGLIRVTP